MEEYLKERKSRFNGLKIKGRIIENQGLKHTIQENQTSQITHVIMEERAKK